MNICCRAGETVPQRTWAKQYSSAVEPSAMVTRQVMQASPVRRAWKRTEGLPALEVRSSRVRMLGSSTVQVTVQSWL